MIGGPGDWASRSTAAGSDQDERSIRTFPVLLGILSAGYGARAVGLLCHDRNMAEPGDDHLSIEHLTGRSRFRLSIDGREAVVLDYVARPGVWDITHTYADPAFRGTGVASRLVQHVFDEARAGGIRIIPSCPYIPVWVSRHPADADLIGLPR